MNSSVVHYINHLLRLLTINSNGKKNDKRKQYLYENYRVRSSSRLIGKRAHSKQKHNNLTMKITG